MVTHSGVRIEPAHLYGGLYAQAPGIRDLAIGQYRMCRYGGHTNQWWSVLQHSIAMHAYLKVLGSPTLLLMEALLHDAHEAITADVPSSWKPNAMRDLQDELDARIHKLYGLPYPLAYEDKRAIKEADHMMLLAEATAFGPPGILSYFDLSALDPRAQDAVCWVHTRSEKDDPRTLENTWAIDYYLKLFHHLCGEVL